MKTLLDMLPDAPVYSEKDLEVCQLNDDYRPILFEYYKFIAQLAVVASCIEFDSPAWLGRSRKTYEVVSGKFTRIHRLMGANLEFFQHDKYGEATFIIDRCILETVTKIRWIVSDRSDERTTRFLEGSLKPDLEHEQRIRQNIEARGGEILKIEERMLERMDGFKRDSGLPDLPHNEFRKMPDLYSMMRDIGEDRQSYVSIGKVGSHHVHGNWQSLLGAYLQETEHGFTPRFDLLPSFPDQYTILPIYVLQACTDYIAHCFDSDTSSEYLEFLYEQTTLELMELNRLLVGDDFAPVDQ